MQQRYALRFENGERRGETIPITGSGITVGRKPGNSVQILDASVSGRHAELVVDSEGVLVRDLGSTNGTRIGSERISEQRVAHADAVLFGNVRLTFIDSNFGDVPAAPDSESKAPGADAIGEGVRTISADAVARSRKTSVASLIVLLLAIVLAAGGGWFWLQGRTAASPTAQLRAVEPVAGNHLAAGYSFEGDGPGWQVDESVAGAFSIDTVGRRSGAQGLSATLGANEVALSRSGALSLAHGRRALKTTGWLRSEGDVETALGLEFSSNAGSAATTTLWARAPKPGGDFEAQELRATAPAGYDTVRVVVVARARAQGGSADVDDVSLIYDESEAAPLALDEYQLFGVGTPPSAAVLHKIDRMLLSGIAVLSGGQQVEIALASSESGFSIQPSATDQGGAGSDRALVLRVEPALAQQGVATMGTGGFRTHNIEFAREGVAGLLLGAGKDLVHLKFEPPANLRARPEADGFQVEAALGAARGIELQLVFRAERDEAQGLARSARNAEAQSQLGEALAHWARLRDEFPFETALLTEAETSRGRLMERGFNETRALRQELDNARFFRLLDIFRACRERATALAARYGQSDIEREARELVQQIDVDLAGLEAELSRAEAMRLEGIAKALSAQKNPKLAERVREYLAERFSAAQNASAGGQ